MYIHQNTDTKKKYTLGKEERVKSRKLIDLLFTSGHSFLIFPIRVHYLFLPGQQSVKAGFTASTRNFKKAVDRNRVKRLMREAYRLQLGEIKETVLKKQKHLLLFFVYTGKEFADFVVVKEKIKAALQKLTELTNENNSANT